MWFGVFMYHCKRLECPITWLELNNGIRGVPLKCLQIWWYKAAVQIQSSPSPLIIQKPGTEYLWPVLCRMCQEKGFQGTLEASRASLLPEAGLSTSPGAEQWFLLFGSCFCCSSLWSIASVGVTSVNKASVCQLTLQAVSQAIFLLFWRKHDTRDNKIPTTPNKVLVSAGNPSVVQTSLSKPWFFCCRPWPGLLSVHVKQLKLLWLCFFWDYRLFTFHMQWIEYFFSAVDLRQK